MSLAACALHHASTPFCRCGDSARMAAQANISMKQPLHTRTRNMEAARTVQRAAGAPCPNAARCAGRRGGARCGAQRGRAGAPGAGARPGRARRRRPAGPPGVPPGRAHGARAPHCRRCRGRAPAARLSVAGAPAARVGGGSSVSHAAVEEQNPSVSYHSISSAMLLSAHGGRLPRLAGCGRRCLGAVGLVAHCSSSTSRAGISKQCNAWMLARLCHLRFALTETSVTSPTSPVTRRSCCSAP